MTDKTEPEEGAEGERVARAISRAGRASRRDAEKLIEEGRVSVNGRVLTSPAVVVTAADRISVDGVDLAAPEPARLWRYHKPAGLVTSARDEKGRETVFDALPTDLPRVMSIGRLDLSSEGLLLLTNDGALKRRLELPSTGWLRRYRVRVNGRPDDASLAPLRAGLRVEGEDYLPMEVRIDRQQGANAWLTIGLREGRNREIRRAMEAVGLVVNRLIRVSYGPFQLGDLEPGAVEEVRAKVLRDQLGLDVTGPEETIMRAGRKPGVVRVERKEKTVAKPPARTRVSRAQAADPSAALERPGASPARRATAAGPKRKGAPRPGRLVEGDDIGARPARAPARAAGAAPKARSGPAPSWKGKPARPERRSDEERPARDGVRPARTGGAGEGGRARPRPVEGGGARAERGPRKPGWSGGARAEGRPEGGRPRPRPVDGSDVRAERGPRKPGGSGGARAEGRPEGGRPEGGRPRPRPAEGAGKPTGDRGPRKPYAAGGPKGEGRPEGARSRARPSEGGAEGRGERGPRKPSWGGAVGAEGRLARSPRKNEAGDGGPETRETREARPRGKPFAGKPGGTGKPFSGKPGKPGGSGKPKVPGRTGSARPAPGAGGRGRPPGGGKRD